MIRRLKYPKYSEWVTLLSPSLFPFLPPPFLFSLLLATFATTVHCYHSLCQDGHAILARTEDEVWFCRCLRHGLAEPLVRSWLLRFPTNFFAASEGGPCSSVTCPPATRQGAVGNGYGRYGRGMVSASGCVSCPFFL
uniref:Uncharacterized protein n=1 Tax=Ananas comosus var. bracteatus TaxID=296719 RepID=A0A6V7NSV6_ANACO|nr:unnamed protein product [Ananas comosus var. bracteatus]